MAQTVSELIAVLQRLPQDAPIGTTESDYVGEKFYAGVRVEDEYVSESGRLDPDGRPVVVLR